MLNRGQISLMCDAAFCSCCSQADRIKMATCNKARLCFIGTVSLRNLCLLCRVDITFTSTKTLYGSWWFVEVCTEMRTAGIQLIRSHGKFIEWEQILYKCHLDVTGRCGNPSMEFWYGDGWGWD